MHVEHAYVCICMLFMHCACFFMFNVIHVLACFFPCVVHVLASSHCLVCFGMHLVPIFAGFVCSIFSSFSPVGHVSRVYFPPIFSLSCVSMF